MTPLIPDPEIWAKLTWRECQVFIGISEGLTDKEIAIKLGLAVGTIHAHCNKLYMKAGAHSRVDLVMKIAQLQPPTILSKQSLSVSRETSERAA